MYYGFDIGGTKIALGVFDKDLKLQWETRVTTPRDSYDDFLTAIAALVACKPLLMLLPALVTMSFAVARAACRLA